MRAGRKLVLQPIFAKNDCKFTVDEILRSADVVASDRSRNERAVNRCKESGYIIRGHAPGGDAELMDDVHVPLELVNDF